MDWQLIISGSILAAIGPLAVVYCLAAIGINIQFGYTGLLNFGQAGFMAVAAYGLAVSVTIMGWPFWVGIVIGLVATVILAFLLGIPTLRLRADYLAIVTIAAAEIIRLVVRSESLKETFGSTDGIQKFSSGFIDLSPFDQNGEYGFWRIVFNGNELWILVVGWGLVALFSLAVLLLMRSPWGRVLKAIREDEDAVRSLGKNVYWYKMQSLILGGLVGAFGGFLYGISQAAIQPDNFTTNLTFFAYTIVILGGAARVFGPILGAILFWFLIQFTDLALTQAVESGVITFLSSEQAAQIRFVLAGVALMLLMIYRPQGILGDRREIALDER
jgi:branched-chain amino acid transport system permease protein